MGVGLQRHTSSHPVPCSHSHRQAAEGRGGGPFRRGLKAFSDSRPSRRRRLDSPDRVRITHARSYWRTDHRDRAASIDWNQPHTYMELLEIAKLPTAENSAI